MALCVIPQILMHGGGLEKLRYIIRSLAQHRGNASKPSMR